MQLVLALYDNTCVDDDSELTFKEGDVLVQEALVDGDWIKCRHLLSGDMKGLVPNNYVGELPNEGHLVRAEFGMAGEEETELSFAEGDLITCIYSIDSNWFVGKGENGLVGLVPSNYVKPFESAVVEHAKSPPREPRVSMNKNGVPKTASVPDLMAEIKAKTKLKGSIDAASVNGNINNGKPLDPARPPIVTSPVVTKSWDSLKPQSPKEIITAVEPSKVTPRFMEAPKPVEPKQALLPNSSEPPNIVQKPIDVKYEQAKGEIIKTTPKPEAAKFRLPDVKLKTPEKAAESPKFTGSAPQKTKKKNDPRVWSSKAGSSKQEASYLKISDDQTKVLLEKPDGKIIQVPLDSLSVRDIEYINRVEGRIVYKQIGDIKPEVRLEVTPQPKEQPRVELKVSDYSVNGFNWLTFLANNTKLPKESIIRYAEIFSKAKIGEKDLGKLEAKKIVLWGVKMVDVDEVMGAVKKMLLLLEDTTEDKLSRMSLSPKQPQQKTTIMIPQFAIEQFSNGNTKKTVTIEQTVNEPVVTKVIESEPLVYEMRRSSTSNAPQPNGQNIYHQQTLAARPTSPGIIHRNSIGYAPVSSYPQHQQTQQQYPQYSQPPPQHQPHYYPVQQSIPVMQQPMHMQPMQQQPMQPQYYPQQPAMQPNMQMPMQPQPPMQQPPMQQHPQYPYQQNPNQQYYYR